MLKSPALSDGLKLLTALEAAAAKRHSEAVAKWEADVMVAKEAEKVVKDRIRKALRHNDRASADALARKEADRGHCPPRKRYLVNDPTVVCHVIDAESGPVSLAAVLRAASWAEYLEVHARRLYRSVTHADTESAIFATRRFGSG